jgi:hypothetical protein
MENKAKKNEGKWRKKHNFMGLRQGTNRFVKIILLKGKIEKNDVGIEEKMGHVVPEKKGENKKENLGLEGHYLSLKPSQKFLGH